MPTKKLTFSEPVNIIASAADGAGAPKGPPTFSVAAYKWGAVSVRGWDRPVVIDSEGLEFARSIVANLEHDESKPVGHVTKAEKTDEALMLDGVFSLDDELSTKRILNGARNKFPWEASVEVTADMVEEVDAGESVEVNGQSFNGPLYVARKGTLYGFGFVLHGADKNTDVSIAASDAASHKENAMELEQGFKAWAEKMLPGTDITKLSDEAVKNLQANYEGQNGNGKKIVAAPQKGDALEKRLLEASRRKEIMELAEVSSDQAIELERYDDIATIRDARDEAVKVGTSVADFQHTLQLITLSQAPPRVRSKSNDVTDKVLEAAVCMAGGLKREMLEDKRDGFDDQTLQMAHDRFKGRIGLNETIILAAESRGYRGRIGNRVDLELHNAAFGLGPNGNVPIRAGGFSTISLPNVFSNVANKFIREAFMAGDQTPFAVSATRAVNDFKQVTTLSLTGDMQFEPVGADGEIKHGTVGEEVYTNQVDLAGRMFAITFKDIRNDDLGALTQIPRRIGRGGILYLNHIFWTVFLNNSAFFTSGRNNVNEGVATMTTGGLSATEVIFMNQTDPDGKPLGAMPKIMLVPTAHKSAALTLMNSEKLIDGTATATQGDSNIWRGRFRVESSPYMSNSAYTGFSAAAWYLLADPSELPVIEIAGLDGQYQPTVETADAAFNVLGTQMRGWFAIGVNLQEYRGGVRADGGAS